MRKYHALTLFHPVLFVIGILLVSQPMSHAGGLRGKVVLHLGTDKARYVSGEIILLNCYVRNSSGVNISIPVLKTRGSASLTLIDSKGKVVPSGVIVGTLGEESQELLHKGETVVKTFVLGQHGNTDLFTGSIRNLRPDTYRIWVTLADVISDTLRLVVVEPSSSDRRLAERLNKLASNYGKSASTSAISDCNALIQEYPHSPLLPNVYFEYMNILSSSQNWDRNSRQLKTVAIDFIERFPDSDVIHYGVHFYAIAVQNEIGVSPGKRLSSSESSFLESELQEKLLTRLSSPKVSRFVTDEIARIKLLEGKK